MEPHPAIQFLFHVLFLVQLLVFLSLSLSLAFSHERPTVVPPFSSLFLFFLGETESAVL